jgi:hypothetical protein
MKALILRNDRVAVRVGCDGQIAVHGFPQGKERARLLLEEGTIDLPGTLALAGVLRYPSGSVFESLVVRRERDGRPLVERCGGTWPDGVLEDELETYPCIHFLEERRTGAPWRYERWYTLVGNLLILDSDQYFERSEGAAPGKTWERFLVQLRQAFDLAIGS